MAMSDTAGSITRTWARIRLLRESPVGMVGALLVIFWILVAIFAPVLSPYDPNANDMDALLDPTPNAVHWLGTDMQGRDLLSRVIWGSRTVLTVAPVAVIVAYAIGSLLGLLAGYYRGWVDNVVNRVSDIILSFPAIVLYIMFVEILPNARGPLIVDACLRMGYTTIAIGVLGFLGLGLPPPTPDWGGSVKDNYALMSIYPHMALFPALAISSLVVGFSLLADGMREISMRD
jgi:peptide/nickel transport system permease protein